MSPMPTHHNGSEEERRALNAFISLTRAAESVGRRTDEPNLKHGLTVSQFGTLEALYHLGPMCLGDLGEKLLRSSGNMTTVIDNLEKRGLVQRVRDEADRRRWVVHLTDAGLETIEAVYPPHVEAIVGLMSILTPAEQDELRRLCKIVGKQERDT